MATINMESMLTGQGSGGANGGNFWNYYNPNREDYTLTLIGELMEISLAYATKYKSSEIDRWDDGNPKLNMRLHLKDASGTEWLYDVQPKGRVLLESLLPICPHGSLEDLLGHNIQIQTQEPPVYNGQVIPYSKGMPRPFVFQDLGPGPEKPRGVNNELPPDPQHQQQQQQRAQAPGQQVQAMVSGQPSGPIAMMAMQQQQPQAPVPQQVPGNQPWNKPQPQQQQVINQQPMQQAIPSQPPVPVYDADLPF